jgi:hypothetical protein
MDEEQEITKKELVQGILWAEILGPPRAKKPYRSQLHK